MSKSVRASHSLKRVRLVIAVAILCLLLVGARAGSQKTPVTLCTPDEEILFSCAVKRSAKIVSLCSSRDLTKERGYLQYRFGMPGKIELEFPQSRAGTQEKFQYSHYFRAQVDLTSITFRSGGYEYSIFSDYNGEEKPAVAESGVRVTAAGGGKENSLVCSSKPKLNLANLADVLPEKPE